MSDTTEIDPTECPAMERVPGRASDQWVVKNTRIPVQAVPDNPRAAAPLTRAQPTFR